MNSLSLDSRARPSFSLMNDNRSSTTAPSTVDRDHADDRPRAGGVRATAVETRDQRARSTTAETTDVKEAIFGSFDGMTSTLGVVAGLLATKSSASHVVAGAIGIAVAATIGMGAGQYLSDDQRNVRKALVMALATLVGSILPAIPFLFGTSHACVLASLVITALAAAVIGHYRGYLITYGILIVVSAITIGLSLAVA
jgi:VIT1/CCC1 family predicted Fe2+/Mn2+ transporter